MSTITSGRYLPRHHDAAPPSTAQRRRGIFRRIIDAIMLSRQRSAQLEIARVLGRLRGTLTDEMERKINEHLFNNRNLRL